MMSPRVRSAWADDSILDTFDWPQPIRPASSTCETPLAHRNTVRHLTSLRSSWNLSNASANSGADVSRTSSETLAYFLPTTFIGLSFAFLVVAFFVVLIGCCAPKVRIVLDL